MGDYFVNPKDQEITRRVIVVWTQRTRRSPGRWLLCEPKGPGDHQAGDCCVNPKDQEITRQLIVVWTLRTRRSPGGWWLCEPKGPRDPQAGDCCVNPKDQEITWQVIVVWTQRTRRSPGRWLLCEPKGPGDHLAGDCCVNPKDQEITRQVIVVVVWVFYTEVHWIWLCVDLQWHRHTLRFFIYCVTCRVLHLKWSKLPCFWMYMCLNVCTVDFEYRITSGTFAMSFLLGILRFYSLLYLISTFKADSGQIFWLRVPLKLDSKRKHSK